MYVIAGYGFVGKAFFESFKKHYNLYIVDPLYNSNSIADLAHVDGVICCVSTPASEDGSCNTDNVIDVISKTPADVPVLIKSTIDLTGLQRIHEQFPDHIINFSPEFLRADSAIEDMKNLQYTIISSGAGFNLWKEFFTKVYPDLIFYSYKIEDCIGIKYFENSFLATKLSFFNEMFDFCTAYGLDYHAVRDGITKDPRIGESHTFVDPELGFRGWGGHCFPKDTAALLNMANKKGVDLNTLEAAVEYNKTIRK
jgi:nucleotide sugar dehydrogenase